MIDEERKKRKISPMREFLLLYVAFVNWESVKKNFFSRPVNGTDCIYGPDGAYFNG